MDIPKEAFIDYYEIVQSGKEQNKTSLASFLQNELPFFWRDAYFSFSKRSNQLHRISHSSYEYLFDDFTTSDQREKNSLHVNQEARVVAVYGYSQSKRSPRDDSRLRGWSGVSEKTTGLRWDKGHFIGHSIGGAVDGLELNIFIQRRDLNRGWSVEGKIYRKMERYCSSNPKTFCFSRPIYLDGTSKPSFLEFGLLKEDNDLWVECFDNR